MSDEYYKRLVDGAATSAADDATFEIATARSAKAKRWANETLTFGEFKQRLQYPIRTRETMDEYALMEKIEQSRIKDVGGFVGGPSLDGGRKKESIATRTLFAADLDHATPGFLAAPEAVINFAAVLYSTHSHTPEAPRVRLVAPMSRIVRAAEYEIIARQVARDIGEAMFDPCTYNVNQLMFWPSCPADCRYYYREIDGPALDVDALLARGTAALTALAAPEKPLAVDQRAPIRPQDPRTKDGVIGAFCRAYTVSAGIRAFLAGCYEYAGSDGPGRARYTWTRGEGARGLIVYDDLFAYSHHSTDPAADGHAQNIFDLVCIHRFNGDTKSAIKALGKDPAVVRVLDDEHAADFRPEVDIKDTSPADWRLKLERGERGEIKPTLVNCEAVLTNDTRFKGFGVNILAEKVEVTGPVPWTRRGSRFWRESDRNALCVTLNKLYAPFRNIIVDTVFSYVTESRAFNPLAEWFKTLPAWDKTPRIDTLLSRCLGAEQSEYTAAVMRKTLLAAAARVYEPGMKFDYVPVLDGKQGIGKSTFWRLLAGKGYFTNALTLEEMGDKRGAEKIQGMWFAELDELAGMSKADIRKMKSFISSETDDYRAAYERTAVQRPRLTILVGTVNGEDGYLRDPTGNRRFWPVVCKGAPEGAKAVWTLEQDRAQIWAEALEMYNALCHDKRALARALQMDTPETRAAALKAQNAAIESTSREQLVEAYLDTPILRPEVWCTLTPEERAHFMRGEMYAVTDKVDLSAEPRVQRNRVCLLEIYLECFYGARGRYDKREAASLAQTMKRLDPKWVKSGRGDFGPYGRGIEYTRTSGDDDTVEIPF